MGSNLTLFLKLPSSVYFPRPSLYEALAHHGDLADGAEEALVVPRQLLEGHELGAPQTSFA